VIALDTNVLVRFLVADDMAQHQRVVALFRRGIARGETFFVGDVVVAELTWVLRASYRFERAQIAAALRALLEAEHLVFESTDLLRRALLQFQSGSAGFADCLTAERGREAGCATLVTFDRALLGQSGVAEP
jgi:predicted nucleic-acid-binding protein